MGTRPQMSGKRQAAGRGTGRAKVWTAFLFCLLLVCAGGASASVTAAEAQGANADPVARDNAYRIKKDGTLRVLAPGVLSNDLDPDGDRLSAARETAPRHGRLELRGGGSFVYTPDKGFRGRDSFVYRATDASGGTDTATVEITVWAKEWPPLARNNSYRVEEDRSLTVRAPGILRNDSELDGARLFTTQVSGPAHGDLSLGRDGSFVYKPDKDFNGEDRFVYRAADRKNRDDNGIVEISVGAVNDAPVFTGARTNTSQTINEGAGLAALEATDADGDALTFELVGGPLPPGITLGDGGRFAGSASGRAAGNYTTNVKVSDGSGGSDTTALSITVNPVEEAPVAEDADVTVDEDVAKTITLSATDPDTDSLAFSLTAQPNHGDLGMPSTPDCVTSAGAATCTATVVYTPDADYNGPDSFTFAAGGSQPATVRIAVRPVNDAPVARSDAKTTPENSPLVFPASDLLANDSKGAANEDAQALSVTGVTNPQHGTVNLKDGEITFTPTADYNGPASFEYTVCDSGSPRECSTQTAAVNVTVSPVNSAPTAQNGALTMNEDGGPLQIDLGPLVSDVETSDANLDYAIVSGPTPQQGSLSGDGPTFTFDSADDFAGSAEISYKVTDRGDPDNCGAPGAGCAAAKESATRTVTVTVDPVNDPPTNVSLSSSSVDENEPSGTLVGTLSTTDPDAGDTHSYALVSGAGSDDNAQFALSGDRLETAARFNKEAKGSYTVRVRSTEGSGGTSEKQFTITVNNVNEAPTDVSLSNSSVDENRPPGTIVGSLLTTDEDAGDTHSYTLVAGLGSDDNDRFRVSGDELQTGAAFDHEADAGYTVRVRSTDSGNGTFEKQFTIAVNDANDAPTAADDTGTTDEDTPLNVSAPGVLGNDADEDAGDTRTVGKLNGSATLTGTSAKGATVTMNADGSYTYDPGSVFQRLRAGQNDTDTFTYKAKDGGGLESGAATVTVTITGAADPAVISSGGTLDYEENDPPTSVDGGLGLTHPEGAQITEAEVRITDNYQSGQDVLAFNDNDPDDNIALDSGSTGESLTLTGEDSAARYQDALRAVTYENTSENPSDLARTVTFKATDANSATSSPATRNIAVTPVDDPPVAVNDGASVDEDVAATAVPVLDNDTDPDGGQKTISSASDPVNGTVDLTGGSPGARTGLTYRPDADYCNDPPTTDPDTFTYTLNGGSTATVSMTVICVNDAPVAESDSWQTFGNTELRVDLASASTTPHTTDTTSGPKKGTIANDSDPVENDEISVSGIVGCSDNTEPYDCTVDGQKVSMQGDGSFGYTPAPGSPVGLFQYTLKDDGGTANGGQDTATGTVNLVAQEMVWYVDPQANTNGTGVSDAPLNSFSGLNGAGGSGDSDSANQYVFVHDGTLNGASIELEAGQRLLGEGVGLSINRNLNGNGSPTTLQAAGTAPVLNGGSSDAIKVTAALPAEIRGMVISSTGGNAIDMTTAAALTGASTLLIDGNTFSGAGAETIDLNVSSGSSGSRSVTIANNTWTGTHAGNGLDSMLSVAGVTLALDIQSNTIVANGHGISVNSSAGTSAIRNLSNNTVSGNTAGSGIVIQNSTFDADGTTGGNQAVSGGTTAIGVSGNPVGGSGIVLVNAQGSLAFTQFNIFNSNGTGLGVTGTGGGFSISTTANVSEIISTGGPAADISSAAAALPLTKISSTNSTTTGVSLTNVTGGFSATDTTSAITNPTGTDFNINGGTANVTYAGKITDDLGQLVRIANTTGGTKTFTGAITDNDDGDGGVFTEGSVHLDSNTGATTNFTGGMLLSTGGNHAFRASGGGTVNVCDKDACSAGSELINKLTTTTGTALNVSNTTIGSNGLKFRSISAGTSASGPTNGIVLNNTGANGSLAVTGNNVDTTASASRGTNNSGGVIQNTTGAGISLQSTLSPSFTNVHVLNTDLSGVAGTDVTDFTFKNGKISDSGTNHVLKDSNIRFNTGTTENNLDGNVAITGNLLERGYDDGVGIHNYAGTIGDLNVSNNTVTSATTSTDSQGNGIQVVAFGNGSTAASVTRATINNNTINNVPVGVGLSVQCGNSSASGPGGTCGTPGSATNEIEIVNNTLTGLAGTGPTDPNFGIGSEGILASVQGGNAGSRGRGNFEITGNALTNVFGHGISNSTFGNSTVTSRVTNNTIDMNNAGGRIGSQGIGGGLGITQVSSETPLMTVQVSNNTITDYDGDGVRLVALDTSGTLNATVTNNSVGPQISAGFPNRIRVDSGNGNPGNNTVNLKISGNLATGGSSPGTTPGIGLRKEGTDPNVNRFAIEGLIPPAGATNPQVVSYVTSQNPGMSTGDPGLGYNGTDKAEIINGSGFVATGGSVPAP